VNREYEAKYHLLEEGHWWFRARRDLVRSLVLQLCPDRSKQVLEIGCSSGVLIRCLQQEGYASVVGIDISKEAIAECHRHGTSNAQVMDAQRLDFPDDQFDIITASDVLEHLADDVGALRDWHRVLKPGGAVVIFVPAFRLLWSEHDVANQHHRRYRLSELNQKVVAAGFAVERQSYWNTSLFLPIAAVRAVKRLFPKPGGAKAPDNDLFPPPAPVNWALLQTLSTENFAFVRGLNFPFGVSAMIIARKRRAR
jgi:ubiquinone/menaquinone biosynthesis C-methylase UbiE